ncbi:hypothetical protein P8C59_006612 [Phyllachora maydis]|uniref:Uncharacterized protein n=1 Tax=Phyllachora maydis TaxID=1825666 RepID=A0AAD9MFP4_9PEZI|nr:hypothetical protein P8C59_006612 [Phyllachora maydis]
MASSSSSSNVTLLTSSWLSCAPATYTTTYTITKQTACPTSAWVATYTVTEVCTGNPANFTTPAVPSGFVVSTVTCGSCATPTMTITCPSPAPTGSGTGNGNGNGNGNGVTQSGPQPSEMTPAMTPGSQAPPPPAMTTKPGPGTGYVTAGAPSLKHGLLLALGIAAAALGVVA